MLRRVWKPVIPSTGAPSSDFRGPFIVPSGSTRAVFRRYTPVNMIRKPQSREIVLTASEVLNPPNKMKDARMVALVNVT